MGNLTAIIAADTTGFKKSVEDAKKILDNFNKAEGDTAKQLRETNNVSEMQVAAFNRVNRTLSKVSSGAMSTAQAEKALSAQVKELKIQYANLSDTAKNGEFGKALRRQSEDAERYLRQLQSQLKSVGVETEKVGSKTTQTSNKFSQITSIITKYGAQLAIASTALKVLKDAFMSSEDNIDSWGRTTLAAESAYQVFLTSLNSGNWSNFFRNLNDAIGGAIELYNKLDRLGSIKSNNEAAKAIVNKELAELRLRKQQGENVDAEIKAKQEQLNELNGQEVEAGKDAGLTQIVRAIRNQNGNVTEEVAERIAKDIVENGQEAFDNMDATVARLLDKAGTKEITKSSSYGFGEGSDTYNVTETVVALENLTDEEKTLLEAYQAAHQAETKIAEGINTYASAINLEAQNAQSQFKYNKWTGANGGGSNKSESTIKPFDLKVNPISIGRTEAQIKEDINKIQKKIENTPDGALRIQLIAEKQDLVNELNNFGKDPIKVQLETQANNLDLSGLNNVAMPNANPNYKGVYEGIKDVVEASKEFSIVWEDVADNWDEMDFGDKFFALSEAIFSSVDAVSSFVEGIGKLKDMVNMFKAVSSAASKQKIAENAAETASEHSKTAAETGSAAAGIFSAHSSIPWVGVAIAIGLIGAMMAVMSQFHNGGIVGKFAGGGMIKGSSSLGDMNLARVNNGEMILNGTQQSHLFNLLNSSGGYSNAESGNVQFRIQGEDLIGVLNNYNRRNNKVI